MCQAKGVGGVQTAGRSSGRVQQGRGMRRTRNRRRTGFPCQEECDSAGEDAQMCQPAVGAQAGAPESQTAERD